MLQSLHPMFRGAYPTFGTGSLTLITRPAIHLALYRCAAWQMRRTPSPAYSENQGLKLSTLQEERAKGAHPLSMRNAHRWRAALDMLLWDVLLAFAMWQAAYLFQAAVGLAAGSLGALFSPSALFSRALLPPSRPRSLSG